MSRWVEISNASSIREGGGRTIQVGQRSLAVFNDGGTYYATDDDCPHQNASLADGAVSDGRVICPRDSHKPVQAYPTRCTDGTVEVFVAAGEQS